MSQLTANLKGLHIKLYPKILKYALTILFFIFSSYDGFAQAQADNADKIAALQLVTANKATLGLSTADLNNIRVSDSYMDKQSGTRYVYLQQTYLAIPVYNQIQVITFKNDKVLSNTANKIDAIEQKINLSNGSPLVTAASAVMSAVTDRKLVSNQTAVPIVVKENGNYVEFGNMGISRQNITARLMWLPNDPGKTVRLAWQVYIIPINSSDYWLVKIDAANNSPLGADNLTVYCNWDDHDHFFEFENKKVNTGNKFHFDFKPALNLKSSNPGPFLADNADYRVIPYPAEAPSFPGGAHAIRTNPWTAASANATTLKWHSTAVGTDYNYTRGNNVWAYHDRTNINAGDPARSATSSTALPNLTFDFTPDFTVEPTTTVPPNQQFNITNLFYWNNIIHDVMYTYGFNEPAANFQFNNLGRGGNGNDHVLAEAQDGSGSNNANFSTPADGGSGRMQMYLWTAPTPDRDGDVDNGIIVHEYGHGISNRLTGGPAGGANCLGNAEQMGEGWSDYYALMFTQDWATSNLNTGFTNPRGIGTYAQNQAPSGSGIRSQRYCTDFTINNRVYAASISSSPHNRGEIWCATLWDMTWGIIQQEGVINPNINNLAGGGGNNIAMKLVTEGMKLQPCSPGFINGRDAIIQADINLYGGVHVCTIKEAFRRRGMGDGASQGSSNSVTDQVASFVGGGGTLTLLQNGITATPEGQNINYTNRLVVGSCASVSNYKITDTLPSNVTFVSATAGGTYNSSNRVVSWTVNQAASTTVDYNFVVNINTGSYYAPATLLNETVAGPPPSIPASWTTTSTPTSNPWVSSNAQSRSAPNSFFTSNLTTVNDQQLFSTNNITLPASSTTLSFWGYINSEPSWDGGVVEISTNGGGTWSDLGPNITSGGYTGSLSSSSNPLSGRSAFNGNSGGFVKTTVQLASYAGQNVKFRFRFGSDESIAAVGWYIDDILLQDIAHVDMRSNLINASNVRMSFSDSIMLINPPLACTPPTVTAPTVTQPTCGTPTGTIVVNATGSGTLEYSLNSGTYQLSNTFSGLAPGNYNIAVRLQSTPSCITNYSGNPVVINAVPSAPVVNAPTVTQPTCATPTGTIVINATGSGTLEYSVNGGAYQVSNTYSGLAPGNYNITVRLQSSPTCITNYSGNPVVINAVPATPVVNAPTVTQPTCTTPTGTIVVNATGSGTLEYSLNGGAYQLSNTFSALAPGNYNIAVRLQSSPTCITSYSGNPVVINAVPVAPVVNAPTITQPTCATPTGTIVVNATGSGTLEYSLNGGAYQLSNTFSALASGNYNIAVRLQSSPTCITNYSGNPAVINTAPVVPDVNPVSNQALNHGASTTAITFSGSVPGTVYNWTNNDPSIGLAASGSGNIASFIATNTSAVTVTATITVTPSYTNAGGTCTGTPQNFTITVYPLPVYIHGSVKKNADPTKIDVVFKSTYTSVAGEYINYFQFSVAIPAAGNAGVTATAVAVNAFQNMGTLVLDGPYTEGSEIVFNFGYLNPTPPPVNQYNWTNGVEFTGVVVTFSTTNAALVGKMVDFTNNEGGYGGINGNTFYGIVSNTGDKTDYVSGFFYAIPGESVLGNYPSNGDQYVQTIATAPLNDNAPGAFTLTLGAGCAGSPYTNAGATQSGSEPFPSCQGTAGFKTVWYKFTAPASGAVKISSDYSGGTMGTDSRLALYATTDVNNYAVFTSLACDDDNGATVASRSILYYTGLTGGTTYYIQIDGKDGSTAAGTFCLTVDDMTSAMVATSTACAAGQDLTSVNNNYTGWLSATDASGKLVALIRNPAGSGTSTYSNSININAAAVRTDVVSNQKYLDRNYTINNAAVTNVDVRFFFLNTELAALQAADPGVTLANLQATRQTGTVCDNDFVAANGTNSAIAQSGNGSGAGFSWIQLNTPAFSKFTLHTKKGYAPVKTWLQGAYSVALLRHKNNTAAWVNVLNANALTQPYNVPGFGNYAGTESVSAGFFVATAATTDVTDWVLLELRDATTPATVITRRAAFIREDGRIVDLDGVSNVSFRNIPDGNYFYVIRHRNHLLIRSSVVRPLTATMGVAVPAVYDFSTALTQAFDNVANTVNDQMVNLGGGVFGMMGGNANGSVGTPAAGNATIRASGGTNPLVNDYVYLITTVLGGNVNTNISNIYHTADLNMDGTVRANGGTNPAINDYIFLITTALGGDVNKVLTQHQ